MLGEADGRARTLEEREERGLLGERPVPMPGAQPMRHAGTGERPVDRLAAEQAAMLPYEPPRDRIEAASRERLKAPLPIESLQHPLSVYGELLEGVA